MKRKLVALMALLASLSLAQSTDSHTVTVNIPSVLQLTLDATDYLFNFDDATASGTVTVNNVAYTKASQAAYYNFLDNASGTQDFAPTSVAGTNGADYGNITVRTNRAQWMVKIASITDSNGNATSLTLGNNRVKVFAEKASGKGASWTNVPTTVASNTTLFNAGSGGQGKSVYKLYYLFTMDINDDIPLSGINNEQITINLVLTSP